MPSIAVAELKVHGVAPFAEPVSAPCEAYVAEDLDNVCIHRPAGSLRVGSSVQIDGDAPGVGGKFRPRTLHAERKAAAQAVHSPTQTLPLNLREHVAEGFGQQLVTANLIHHQVGIPGKREWEGKIDARKHLALPACIESPVRMHEFENIAE